MKPTRFKSKTTPWRVQIPGRYFLDGKRKTKYFASEKLARQFCQELKRSGRTVVEKQNSEELDRYGAIISHALEALGNDPAQVLEAISHFKKTKLNLVPKSVRAAVEEFQTNRITKVSPATLDADRWRLLKLINAFERRQMSQISEADLRRFFDELGTKMNTRSVHKSVRKFFDWAKQYNYVAEDPMLNLKPEHDFGINNEIYTPAEFQRMLSIAAGLEGPKPGKEPTRDFIDLLPWFVLSGFCGLRSCEAFRLKRNGDAIRWGDLYFDRGFIHIREEIAKSTRRDSDERHIERPYALAAAQAWLALVPHKGDLIVPWTKRHIQDLKHEFTKATGIKFVKNGLRNSFASYALTYSGGDGIGKLALEMGNSEAIAKRNYIKTLEPGSGKAWFDIRSAPENVISISAAA